MGFGTPLDKHGRHSWGRRKVVLPREEILGNVHLSERLEKLARQQIARRAAEQEIDLDQIDPPSPRPRADPKHATAKFLISACLPREYADIWRRKAERQPTPQPVPEQPPTDWEMTCLIVEAATSLTLNLNSEKTEKVPPRTWLLLEAPEPQATRRSGGELLPFVTKSGSCMLSSGAGGGWIEDQKGLGLLRPVPESRLHANAAEANFGRASSGSSVIALRHAALAMEVLRGRQPPGSDLLNRRIQFAFPPVPPLMPAQEGLPLLPLKGFVHRPSSPQSPPPWPQFLEEPADGTNAGWAEPSTPTDSEAPNPPSPSRPATCATRPGTGESGTRSARLEALVTSRAAASERSAVSARHWRETSYEAALDAEETEEKRFPQAQSMMQRGFHALMEFLDFTNRRYGNPARTWFILDPEANMKLGMRQFERKCMDIGFRGHIPALWKYMDKRDSGVITLLDLHTVTAMELARFKLLIRDRFRDSATDMFRFLDDNRSGRVNRVTFSARLQTLHYRGQPKSLFQYLDRQGLGVLTVHSLAFLDRWQLPPYMYYQPDFTASRVIKDKLLELHQHPLIAWRKMDKDGSMRISYDEFRSYWVDLLTNNKAIAAQAGNLPRSEGDVAAAWRSMDKECSGYIQLRDWDMPSHSHLSAFKRWADRTHGSVVAAFRALDVGGNGITSNCKLSLTELKKCTKGPDGCKADVEFLFNGLDVSNAWSLSENDVKFLDGWDLAWEEWQEEASATKRRLSVSPATFPKPPEQ
mmetsp:Transcript_24436/g.56635  ORF Transcript_24436/g.56635 Transcript_24436/m.56635 type:complete len:755 (-) Transcript_24436:35-2299(-)